MPFVDTTALESMKQLLLSYTKRSLVAMGIFSGQLSLLLVVVVVVFRGSPLWGWQTGGVGWGNNVHWDFTQVCSFHWLHSPWHWRHILFTSPFSSLPYCSLFYSFPFLYLLCFLTPFTSLLSSNPCSFHFPTLHFSAFFIVPICTSLLSSFPSTDNPATHSPVMVMLVMMRRRRNYAFIQQFPDKHL